jgi:quinohemoprotein amine dehydrogenase
MTLSRMVRNHGLQLKEDEAHKILKYLADNYGLAPAEVTPFEYVEERNSTLEGKDKAGLPPNVTGACVQCHSFARIGLQRRGQGWRLHLHAHRDFVGRRSYSGKFTHDFGCWGVSDSPIR